MGGPVRSWIILVLLAAFTVTAVADGFSGEPEPSNFRVGNPEWPPGEKLMLSLRIARAKKDGRGIARYKSLARQRRFVERRPIRGKTAPPLARISHQGSSRGGGDGRGYKARDRGPRRRS
jgi:hypothetical protein